MNPRGRPRALADEQKRRTFLAMISVGAGLEAAARHIGCSVWTIRREALRNEDFAQQLREAETAAELAPLRMMRQAAGTNWRAAAWLLERCYPERFARRKAEDIAPEQVGTLLNEVATIFSEVCHDEAQREQLWAQLEALQQQHLGEAQNSAQGPPQPKSDLERFIEKFDREQDQALTAFDEDRSHLSQQQDQALFAHGA